MNRRRSLVLAAALLALGPGLQSAAQAAYPDHPIRFIVPYPPGGGADVVARTLAGKLQDMWPGAQVIVENRPGADTQIGTQAVARAAPDGYTFGIVTPTFTINKSLYPKLPFDPVRDFIPVSSLARSPFYLVVSTQTSINSLRDLVAASKAANGKMTYSGSSSISYVIGELFRQAAGIDALHVPYKGSSPSVTAVAAGEINYTLDTLLATKGLVQGGKLRVLAVSSGTRSTELPDVPTMAEAGIKDFDLTFWYGMIAPAGTPPELVSRMNEAVGKILQMPDVRKSLQTLGSRAAPTSVREFGDIMKADFARYEAIITANKLQRNE